MRRIIRKIIEEKTKKELKNVEKIILNSYYISIN